MRLPRILLALLVLMMFASATSHAVSTFGDGGVSTTGYVQAVNFVGSGGSLTNIPAGNSITSGTTSVSTESGGLIKFATGGVTTGYFDTSGRLIAPGVSITTANGISSTTGYFSANTGIGTTLPKSPLHVQGANGNAAGLARFTTSDYVDTTTGSGLLIRTGANTGNTYTTIQALSGGFSTLNSLILQPSGGTLGIGTANPSATLDVYGAIHIGNRLAAETSLATAVLGRQGGYIGWNEDNGLGRTNFMNHPGSGGGGFDFSLYDSSGNFVSTPVTINGPGNVGINTTTPGARLDVSGTGLVAQFGANALTDQYFSVRNLYAGSSFGLSTQFSTGGDTILQSGSVKGIAFIVSGSTVFAGIQPSMYITYTGNIGIGTTTPSSTLHLSGVNKNFVVLTMSNELSNTMSSIVQQNASISMRSYGTSIASGGGAVVAYAPNNNVTPDAVQVITSGTTRMSILSNGNTGIGISTPSQALHVLNNGTAGNQTIAQMGTGVGSLFLTYGAAVLSNNMRYNDGQWRYEAAGAGAAMDLGSGSGNIAFYNVASGSAGGVATTTPRMIITAAGPVGIGTVGPSALLHVQATTTATPLKLGNSIMTWTVGPDAAGAFTVYNTGNTGAYIANGATTWSTNSDRRLKKDITLLDAAKGLEAITQLQPVTYHWRTVGAPSATQTGFIAQDVEKVFPTLVSHAPDARIRNDDGTTVSLTDVKGLNYEGLIPPMVQAIKQLKADNDSLRHEFEDYKRNHP